MTGEKVCNVSGQNICLQQWPKMLNLAAEMNNCRAIKGFVV